MNKEKLIEELQKLPDGIEVCIVDARKNLHHASEEPNSIGIEPYYDVEMVSDAKAPFAGLLFMNCDYDPTGGPEWGSSLCNTIENELKEDLSKSESTKTLLSKISMIGEVMPGVKSDQLRKTVEVKLAELITKL